MSKNKTTCEQPSTAALPLESIGELPALDYSPSSMSYALVDAINQRNAVNENDVISRKVFGDESE